MVVVKACPKCNVPVIFGGGSNKVKEVGDFIVDLKYSVFRGLRSTLLGT